jgi:hypothetical protein
MFVFIIEEVKRNAYYDLTIETLEKPPLRRKRRFSQTKLVLDLYK